MQGVSSEDLVLNYLYEESLSKRLEETDII